MKYTFEQHCDEDSFELYALGQLEETKAELFEEHILICESCRVRLDEADRYVVAMKNGAARVRNEAKSPESRAGKAKWNWVRIPTPVWAATLATVCAVVAISVKPFPRENGAEPPVQITLTAQRGEAVSAPAHRKLDLQLDTRGLTLGQQSRAEMVDSGGDVVERMTARPAHERVEIKTSEPLAPGAYYVRIYPQNSSEPAREFALNVK